MPSAHGSARRYTATSGEQMLADWFWHDGTPMFSWNNWLRWGTHFTGLTFPG